MPEENITVADANKNYRISLTTNGQCLTNNLTVKHTVTRTSGGMLNPPKDPTVRWEATISVGGQDVGVVSGIACQGYWQASETVTITIPYSFTGVNAVNLSALVGRDDLELTVSIVERKYTASNQPYTESFYKTVEVCGLEESIGAPNDMSCWLGAFSNLVAIKTGCDAQKVYENLREAYAAMLGEGAEDKLQKGGTITDGIKLLRKSCPGLNISNSSSLIWIETNLFTGNKRARIEDLAKFIEKNGTSFLKIGWYDGTRRNGGHAVTIYSIVDNGDGTGTITITDPDDQRNGLQTYAIDTDEIGMYIKDYYGRNNGRIENAFNFDMGNPSGDGGMDCSCLTNRYSSSAQSITVGVAGAKRGVAAEALHDVSVFGENNSEDESISFVRMTGDSVLTVNSGGGAADIVLGDSSTLSVNFGGSIGDVTVQNSAQAFLYAGASASGTAVLEGSLSVDGTLDSSWDELTLDIRERLGGDACMVNGASYLDGTAYSIRMNEYDQETGHYNLLSGLDAAAASATSFSVYSAYGNYYDGEAIYAGGNALMMGNVLIRIVAEDGGVYADIKNVGSEWIDNFTASGLRFSFDPVEGVDFYTVEYSTSKDFSTSETVTITDTQFAFSEDTAEPLYCRIFMEDSQAPKVYWVASAAGNFMPGDLNGDGRADIVMTIAQDGHPADGSTGAWLIQADQTAAWGDLSQRNPGWEIFGTGITAAGKETNDVYVKSSENVIGAWVTNGTGAVTGWETVGEFDATTNVLGLGDFNGDGQTDLLLRNDNGAVGCFFTSGDVTGWNYFQSLGDEWTVSAVGDLNGDGRDDVVLKHDAGFAGSWLTQEDYTMAWANLDTLQDGFTIVGCGDFDGDGTDDVLLQNGGYYGAWIVEDGSVSSWMGLGSFSGTVEQIADFDGDGIDDLRIRTAAGDLGAQLVKGADTLEWHYYGSVGAEWSTSLAAI